MTNALRGAIIDSKDWPGLRSGTDAGRSDRRAQPGAGGRTWGDIAPRVYGKLFTRHPDMLALFVRDKTGSVRGEMLARTIDVILDFVEAHSYGENFVRCEVVTHEGYGVPREIFPDFFAAIVDVLREILGADWSSNMERE